TCRYERQRSYANVTQGGASLAAMRGLLVALLVVLLSGCDIVAPAPPPTPSPVPPTATPVPRRPEEVAAQFFNAWQQGQYGSMYDLLSADAQAGTPRDVFVRRYMNIHDGIGETAIAFQPGAFDAATNQLGLHISRTLAVYGEVAEDNTLP